MAAPRRTQKQIAERYKGNLGYYQKKHLFRQARFWVSFLVIIGGIAGIILFQVCGRETFFNPGKISSSHARFADDCAQCHDTSLITGGILTRSDFESVLRERFRFGVPFDPIDRKCETCHLKQDGRRHTFHEADVVQLRSCTACHQEHRGPGPLKLVASSNCISCHGNREVMEASAKKGMKLPPEAFDRHPHPAQQVAFDLPRPGRGYTQTFSSFWQGHPEFQLDREKVRDSDTLRFNHQRHFAADIPLVNRKRLDCNYCHMRQPDGRYYSRITFAANCQPCHSLQFDPKNPELTLPHGNATAVRAFLHNLSTQYAELAAQKGITNPKDIQASVTKQMTQLRERVRSIYPGSFNPGEDFEKEVFFASDPYKLQRDAPARVRASFYGCAFCHEVKPVANAAPVITKPIFVDRWMPQANFDHSKHASVKCDDCHHAMGSKNTSDILMPKIANCVTCHSPQGKVVAECITCHTYHGSPSLVAKGTSPGGKSSVKQMLLGASTQK